jgi:K+-transporting ATPase KdpF subunit
MRRPRSPQVTGIYLVCGIVAAALFVYLVVALFNAENL